MSRLNTDDKLTAASISGYTTELTAWRFINDMASAFINVHEQGKSCGLNTLEDVVIEGKKFKLQPKSNENETPAEDIWHLGAGIYRLLMGNEPFGDKGKEGQIEQSPLPHLAETRFSKELGNLMSSCLDFNRDKRPSAKYILQLSNKMTEKFISITSDLNNLSIRMRENRKRRQSLYSFWPESMVVFIILMISIFPLKVYAQTDKEMVKLINTLTMMRDQSNRSEVLQILKKDSLWALMDELEYNTNECTFYDNVNMFGVNNIAKEIVISKKGIVNPGNRFKHSADGVHKYSFIELTAKAMKTIFFYVKEHKGKQHIAIIPFDKNQKYKATVTYKADKIAAVRKNEISYMTVDLGKTSNTKYKFEITNQGMKNASFLVITYNSGI